jgi:hypothetical protein
MSVKKSNENKKKNQYITTESAGASNLQCSHFFRDNGRQFITDPNGDIVNIARLTAYVEHGEEVHDGQIHHEVPLFKMDAPEFLTVLSESEHARFHGSDPEPVVIDGVPRLRPEESE